jgi:hypothetical protein
MGDSCTPTRDPVVHLRGRRNSGSWPASFEAADQHLRASKVERTLLRCLTFLRAGFRPPPVQTRRHFALSSDPRAVAYVDRAPESGGNEDRLGTGVGVMS